MMVKAASIQSQGNADCHLILRGSNYGHSNFNQQSVTKACQLLQSKQLPVRIMIDCSHGNSGKDHGKQHAVIDNICEQLVQPNCAIFGVMLESFIHPGKQALKSADKLAYGISVTDACIGLAETEKLLLQLAQCV